MSKVNFNVDNDDFDFDAYLERVIGMTHDEVDRAPAYVDEEEE